MQKLLLGTIIAGAVGLYAAQASAALSAADKTFVNEAASGGLAEVELGHLAEQKAASPDVKQFGQRMVEDHSKANQELKMIAAQAKLTVPTQPEKSAQTAEQRLQQSNGVAFDQAYVAYMVQDHEKDVAAFRKEAQSGQDPAVKAFAEKYLPVLEQHLQMANNLAKGQANK